MPIPKPIVRIAKPCPASWQKMTPNSTGRHCTSCDKTVVDFTVMSDEEIKSFFTTQKEERICGHFKASQVEKTYTRWQQYLIQAHASIDRKFSFPLAKSALLLFITTVMLLSGCASRTTGKIRIDSTRSTDPNEERLLGDTVYVVPEDTMQKK